MAARDGYGARHNGNPSRRARGAARIVRRIAGGKQGEPVRRAYGAANDRRDAPIWRYDENCLLE
ncbi:hypothetical protein DM81_2198 [Burkholderia multivorans]|nr:hypothetical protein DM80_3097 [Burkholderia multivorans]KGB98165.1 hypothetical protein DM81_2198 [Burkholderia multivorans]